MGGSVVEEHVGKKRRREVRQAVSMKQELNNSLFIIIGVLALGVILTAALTYLSISGIVPSNTIWTQVIPFLIVIVMLILAALLASKWWGLHGEYKKHLERYNISKEDMAAVKRGEL